MVINVKKSIVSMQNTYEYLNGRLSIIDNEDGETVIIEGIDFKDLKEFILLC